MLSIERIKELVDDPSLTDEDAEKIRGDLQRLVEVIFAKWEEDRKVGRLNKDGLPKKDPKEEQSKEES